jgi:hypothetical protein
VRAGAGELADAAVGIERDQAGAKRWKAS